MMTATDQARDLLINALRQYAQASTEAQVELAVLALHKGVQEALWAYLESRGVGGADRRQTSFPSLINLLRDHTDLLRDDDKLPGLLISLNTTRAQIAHPGGDKPTPSEISRDARQFSDIIRRLWPKLFGEAFPASLITPPSKPQRQPIIPKPGVKAVIPKPPSKPRPVKPQPPRSFDLREFLRKLWYDESSPRLKKRLLLKRTIGLAVLFLLSKWCNTGAIYTARWPVPIKYAGVALFLLAVGLFLWGLRTLWRVLCQLRLKRLLTILGVGYVLMVSVSLLTSDRDLPLYRDVWMTTRRLIVSAAVSIHDAGRALASAPAEFRFAYTGHRRPTSPPDADPSYLTPIPANQPAQASLMLSPTPTVRETRDPGLPAYTDAPSTSPQAQEEPTQEQPTAVPLYPPNCPDPQARMTVPMMNQVIRGTIRVEGAAIIENFDYYKFECRREDGEVEDEWHWLASYDVPVEEGVLGTLDVSPLTPGIYTIRLTVVNIEGNNPFLPCDVQVRVVRP